MTGPRQSAVFALVLGCAGSTVDSGTAGQGADSEPWPDTPDIDDASSGAAWTAEEAADAIATALSEVPDADDVLDAYVELLGHGDGYCPSDPLQILDDSLAGCTSEDGHFFAGVSAYAAGSDEYDGAVYEYRELSGDFWIDTPDGQTLEGGGHLLSVIGDSGGVDQLHGSWVWDGGEPWLAYGFSGIYELGLLKGVSLEVSGAFDLRGTYVAMDALVFSESCGWSPDGGLGVRDPNGGWHTMRFADCSPCPEVFYEGTAMGEVCVDLGPFISSYIENDR